MILALIEKKFQYLLQQKKANPYTLKFKYASDMPYYVKVTLKPKETQDTPSLCYSPTDANCKSDRVVLASRVDKKPIVACVKREEIPYNQKNLNTKSYKAIK